MLLIGGTSLLLLFGITVVMVWFAIRFRRSKTKVTSQTGGNTWLEIVWTAVPTVIVLWMFFVGYDGFALMRQPPENPLVVEVTGKRWVWTFHYTEDNVDATEMVVPVNQPVRVELRAPEEDVLHSFYIPEFRVKEDVRPGQQSWLWFLPEEKGEYHIFCAEFCGKDHSKMMTLLRVVSTQDYHAWVREQKAKKNRPMQLEDLVNAIDDPKDWRQPEALRAEAETAYKTFCVACHGAKGDGSGLPGVARDFRSSKGWKKGKGEVDIFRTLTTGIDGTPMRAYPNLSAWQKLALGKYVQEFYLQEFNEAAPEDSEADYAALIKEFKLDQIQPPRDVIGIDKAMAILAQESGR